MLAGVGRSDPIQCAGRGRCQHALAENLDVLAQREVTLRMPDPSHDERVDRIPIRVRDQVPSHPGQVELL